MKNKTQVAVLYGGRSGEHEISLRSAASVVRYLDRTRFEVLPVAIDKQGRWTLVSPDFVEKEAQGETLSIPANAVPVHLSADPSRGLGRAVFVGTDGKPVATADVVFPVLHGPLCEDGTLQGLFELSEVAYVGCGVLASSAGMDKEVSKRLVRDAGVPIVPFVTVRATAWARNRELIRQEIATRLGYPCFVKPANMGSSVGIHKVREASALDAALDDALRYDHKILVEKAVSAREIEVAVLESRDLSAPARVSVCGEIIPTHEFYSYEAKYLDDHGAALLIPARLSGEEAGRIQELAARVFAALEAEGLARVDFFVDKVTEEVFFNEINTLPGFTSISMYPKMWEATGLGYSELLSELIDLGLERHRRRRALLREFSAPVG